MKMKVITHEPQAGGSEGAQRNAAIRVAAYCRVSTEQEIQEGSFELQQAYFRRKINENPDMVLVGVYGDKGKSGRSTHGRNGLQKLLRDCEDGKIDRILVKSISRFARNLTDCLAICRRLRELNIPVIFEKEGVNSMDSTGELLLSIMAAVAQEESFSISENLRWSMERSNAKGEPFFLASYGYRKEPDSHKWRIDESAARRVRTAFQMAWNGSCYREILEALNQMEEEESTGETWTMRRLTYLLKNVSYIGDCVTNKRFTVYTDKRRLLTNKGQRDQFYISNHHEPLVSREVFEQVQARMRARELKSPLRSGRTAE